MYWILVATLVNTVLLFYIGSMVERLKMGAEKSTPIEKHTLCYSVTCDAAIDGSMTPHRRWHDCP